LVYFAKSPTLLVQAVLPRMKARRHGGIIQIGSDSFERALPKRRPTSLPRVPNWVGLAPGHANSARTTSRSISSRGWIPVERHSDVASSAYQRYVADVPLGRLGQPADVAAAVSFLASEAAAFKAIPCTSTWPLPTRVSWPGPGMNLVPSGFAWPYLIFDVEATCTSATGRAEPRTTHISSSAASAATFVSSSRAADQSTSSQSAMAGSRFERHRRNANDGAMASRTSCRGFQLLFVDVDRGSPVPGGVRIRRDERAVEVGMGPRRSRGPQTGPQSAEALGSPSG
jgi:hypothetical protein